MSLSILSYYYVGVLGACIGSFLNVVIHRVPQRMSVARPRSHCPSCQQVLLWYHNIPVLSYLCLHGRCGFCGIRISPAYLLVELLTVLLAVGLFHVFGWSVLLVRYAVLGALLIAVAEIDRRYQLIPNRIIGVGIGLGIVLMLTTDASAWATYGLASLVSAGVLLALRWGSQWVTGRPGMGMGDVKLAAMTGLFLGWENLWVFYLAVLIAGTLGILGLLSGRLQRTTRLPFAPFVAVGTALYIFVLPPHLVWML